MVHEVARKHSRVTNHNTRYTLKQSRAHRQNGVFHQAHCTRKLLHGITYLPVKLDLRRAGLTHRIGLGPFSWSDGVGHRSLLEARAIMRSRAGTMHSIYPSELLRLVLRMSCAHLMRFFPWWERPISSGQDHERQIHILNMLTQSVGVKRQKNSLVEWPHQQSLHRP